MTPRIEPSTDTGGPSAPLDFPSFRRPVPPRPVEAIEVRHPDLPEALDGLTILHLSDLHARVSPHRRLAGSGFSRVLEALPTVHADIIALTGDYMHEPGHERGGLRALAALAEAWVPPRLGAFGVFGNHDTYEFARRARDVPGITWLDNPADPASPAAVALADGALRVLGLSWPEDPLAAAMADGPTPTAGGPGPSRPFRLVLAHLPTAIVPLAALGHDLVLVGHTHGGQIRVSARCTPYTACDAPRTMGTGMLRLGRTLCCISRGLGEGVVAGLRIRCPPQAPLYTLRRGELPGGTGAHLRQVVAW